MPTLSAQTASFSHIRAFATSAGCSAHRPICSFDRSFLSCVGVDHATDVVAAICSRAFGIRSPKPPANESPVASPVASSQPQCLFQSEPTRP